MYTQIRVICIALHIFYGISQSQDVTGMLEGKIFDSQKVSVAAVNVTITGPHLQGNRGAATDYDGYFRLLALPVGKYTLMINHVAYREMTIEDVYIRLGITTTIGDIFLEDQLLETAPIVITGERPSIDYSSTSLGGNLNVGLYRELPVQRDYRNIATLLPQANESYLGDDVNYAGSTGLENKYFVDGVETTDPYFGITGTNLPYNFVREIELRTGGYEAEYRSSLGGILNVITYSGGNEFHGQVFGFYANNQFSGDQRRPALAPPAGDFAQYDFGFSLGGPVLIDRLWFFAAYNPNVQREEIFIPGQGFYEDYRTTHVFAGKLTWQASQRTNLVFSIFGDPSTRDAIGETVRPLPVPVSFDNPDPYLMKLKTGSMSLSLRGTHIINENVIFESSISRITQTHNNQPGTIKGETEALFLDGVTGQWSGGSSGRNDNLSVQTTFRLSGTALVDRHTVKAGLEFRDNKVEDHTVFSVDGRRAPGLYLNILDKSDATLHNRIPSLYLQDSWQITERFKLNVGLRWDGQYLLGSDGSVAQEITDQFQPRIGLIFQPDEEGRHKLFGSFGRFYQELGLALAVQHLNANNVSQAIIFDHDYRIDPTGGDTTSAISSSIQPEVKDLQGQYYDEYSIGYERNILDQLKLGIRGTYRTLGQGVENAFVPDRATGELLYGNPGKAPLEEYPKMKREYTAIELSIEKFGTGKFNFQASYVLSRNYGNYSGLFTSDIVPQLAPNINGAFNTLEGLENGTGLLPNDRTHAFKFFGSYRFDFGLKIGTSFSWISGKPKSEFGFNQNVISNVFINKRGSSGRLNSIWDLNIRFVYELQNLTETWKPRFIVDIFHLGSQREPVAREEVHYFAVDDSGNPTAPNPDYDSPILFQPSMAVKFGLEIDF